MSDNSKLEYAETTMRVLTQPKRLPFSFILFWKQ